MRKIYIHPDHMNDGQVQLDRQGCDTLEAAKAQAAKSQAGPLGEYLSFEVCELRDVTTGEFIGYVVPLSADEYAKWRCKPVHK